MTKTNFKPSLNQRRLARRRQAILCARRMKTWRKVKPSFLFPVMKQAKSTCYAIAYVRQLEFHLKSHNLMPLDEHLSIQDFINHIPKNFLQTDGTLNVDESAILHILVEKGILLEKDCPLTESLVDTVSEKTVNLPRFFAKKINFTKLYADGSLTVTKEDYDYFHSRLVQQLKRGVVAVGLDVYPSYSKLKKEIYYPTNKELAGETEAYGHVMVCSGHNTDRLGRLYYEFQESAGVKVGDGGFVRVYANVVNHFTEMEV